MEILILTKNILAEVEFQTKLLELNNEVFCSTTLLNNILSDYEAAAFNLYQVIIMSETIADDEAMTISQLLKRKGVVIIRKTSKKPNEPEQEEIEEQIVDGYLLDAASKEELREQLYTFEKMIFYKNGGVHLNRSLSRKLQEKKELDVYKGNLNKRENIIFQLLLANRGKTVSREEVCKAVWGDEPTNSNLSQLSLIIKKLKKKADELSLDNVELETKWGEGYKLK